MNEYELVLIPELTEGGCKGCVWHGRSHSCGMLQGRSGGVGREYLCDYDNSLDCAAIVVLVHKVTQQQVVPEELVKRYSQDSDKGLQGKTEKAEPYV